MRTRKEYRQVQEKFCAELTDIAKRMATACDTAPEAQRFGKTLATHFSTACEIEAANKWYTEGK